MDLLGNDPPIELPGGAIFDADGKAIVKIRPRFYRERFNTCVAQIDFLGFSEMLMKSSESSAFVLRTFYQETELYARLGARTDGDNGEPTIALFQYADTLVVAARAEGAPGIIPVVKATAFILASCHGRGLPARAGISRGTVWASSRIATGGSDGDFVTGPAVASAHQVESGQNWAGGAMDPRINWAHDFPAELASLRNEGWLVEYEVPWKSASAGASLAVNWVQALHMYPEAILDLLDVQGSVPTDPFQRKAWDKRKAAVAFFQEFPAGPLGLHDIGIYLVSHSGSHFPLLPVGMFLREAMEAIP